MNDLSGNGHLFEVVRVLERHLYPMLERNGWQRSARTQTPGEWHHGTHPGQLRFHHVANRMEVIWRPCGKKSDEGLITRWIEKTGITEASFIKWLDEVVGEITSEVKGWAAPATS